MDTAVVRDDMVDGIEQRAPLATSAPLQAALSDWLAQVRPKGAIRIAVDIDPQSFF